MNLGLLSQPTAARLLPSIILLPGLFSLIPFEILLDLCICAWIMFLLAALSTLLRRFLPPFLFPALRGSLRLHGLPVHPGKGQITAVTLSILIFLLLLLLLLLLFLLVVLFVCC